MALKKATSSHYFFFLCASEKYLYVFFLLFKSLFSARDVVFLLFNHNFTQILVTWDWRASVTFAAFKERHSLFSLSFPFWQVWCQTDKPLTHQNLFFILFFSLLHFVVMQRAELASAEREERQRAERERRRARTSSVSVSPLHWLALLSIISPLGWDLMTQRLLQCLQWRHVYLAKSFTPP